jgi:hypothetical protein
MRARQQSARSEELVERKLADRDGRGRGHASYIMKPDCIFELWHFGIVEFKCLGTS